MTDPCSTDVEIEPFSEPFIPVGNIPLPIRHVLSPFLQIVTVRFHIQCFGESYYIINHYFVIHLAFMAQKWLTVNECDENVFSIFYNPSNKDQIGVGLSLDIFNIFDVLMLTFYTYVHIRSYDLLHRWKCWDFLRSGLTCWWP